MFPNKVNHVDWKFSPEILTILRKNELQHMASGGLNSDANLHYLWENSGILNLLKSCMQHIPLPPYYIGDYDNLAVLYKKTIYQATSLHYCVSKYLSQYYYKCHCELSSKDQSTSQNSAIDLPSFTNCIIPRSGITSLVSEIFNNKRYYNSTHLLKDFPKHHDICQASMNKYASSLSDFQGSAAIDLSTNSLKTKQGDLNLQIDSDIQSGNVFSSMVQDNIPIHLQKLPHNVVSRCQNFLTFGNLNKKSDYTQYNTSKMRKSYLNNRTKSLSISTKKCSGMCQLRDSRFLQQRNKKFKVKSESRLSHEIILSKKSTFRGTSEEENRICDGFCPTEINNRIILSDAHPTVTLPTEIYQNLIVKSASSATRLIRLLMKSFFSQETLAASSLSGEGIYKNRLQPEITEAIKCFIRSRHPFLKTGSINLCMTDVCVQARRVANNQRRRCRPSNIQHLFTEPSSAIQQSQGTDSCLQYNEQNTKPYRHNEAFKRSQEGSSTASI